MSAQITYCQPDGTAMTVHAGDGTSVMRTAITNGVPGIIGECGGQAMCATCHIYVRLEWLDRLPELSEDEDEMLDCTSEERTERSRLGCQVAMSPELSGLEVDLPASQL